MPSSKMKIKKGDLVQMLSGKDRGKQGRILEAQPSRERVIVENLNMMKRHTKPRPIRNANNNMGGSQMTEGGIIERATAVPVSNVMIVCPGASSRRASATRSRRPRRARRSRFASASAPAAARSSTDGRVRDLRPAPQAALQRRAPRSPAGAARPLVDHAVADRVRRSRSTWASARRRPMRRCSTPRWRS